MKKQIITIAALAVGFLAGATALSAFAQTGGTWTAPSDTPPNKNVAAPINVGDPANLQALQTRNGGLQINGNFGVVGNFIYSPGGAITAGSVLTALDTTGKVGWTAPGVTTECGSDGYMYSRPNAYMDDWDTVAHGDFLEFYCRNHTVRICLSGDNTCAWRNNIAGDDTHTCDYTAGRLASGVGSNSWAEWKAAPPALCSGQAPCTTASNFNTSGTVMAYTAGTNTWYLCSATKQKSILTSY